MYRRILVPLDGSELSECALEHVKAIAQGCNVPEVVLLRAAKMVPLFWDSDYLDPRLINELEKEQESVAREYLEKTAKNLEAEGITVRSVVLERNAAESILDYAANNGVDLIIMTTHGRSGPARWAFGSVTERVLQHSPVPVIVIAPPGCRIQQALPGT